ncbi:MAG: DUF222 domain-containing protein [Pseudonocardiaceae bacterium]|nr:DUF222 domain-containing protein [Pseudonocardiaceae bacterium]
MNGPFIPRNIDGCRWCVRFLSGVLANVKGMTSSVPILECAEVARLADADLPRLLQELEVQSRQLHLQKLRVLAECVARGATAGYGTVSSMLQDTLNLGRGEARQRLAHATSLVPSRTITGADIPAPLTRTGDAAGEGAIGPEHITEIHKALTTLPDSTSADDREHAERVLVELARTAPPHAVAQAGQRLLAHLDPDGARPRDGEPGAPRNLLRRTTRANGRVVGSFDLDAESAALLDAGLSPLSKPRPADENGPDTRTLVEREGDAFADLLAAALRSGTLPTEAGEQARMTVTLSWDALRTGTGAATLNGHAPIPVAEIRRLACCAEIIPVTLTGDSLPLDVGRAHRTAPRALRRALEARDGGCAFPGCSTPARWAEAHHLILWQHGGTTTLRNMCLLCRAHHALIHNSHWEIRMAPDGHPEFLPPAILDPERKPRRNAIHTQLAFQDTN